MTDSIHHFQLHNNSAQQTENFCQRFHLWICSFSFLLLLTLHSLILFFNFKQLLHMQKRKAMLFSQQYIPIITNKNATKQHHSTLLLCQQCFDHAQDYHKTSPLLSIIQRRQTPSWISHSQRIKTLWSRWPFSSPYFLFSAGRPKCSFSQAYFLVCQVG